MVSNSNGQKPPSWSRDELILALDLYMTNRTSPPGKNSATVKELSDLLNRMALSLGVDRQATYRNPNGVYMKMMNFRRFDPNVIADGKVGLTRGNKDEEVVWHLFANNRQLLSDTASAIKANVSSTASETIGPEVEDFIEEADEGRVLTRIHVYRERNRQLVSKVKKAALEKYKKLSCQACGFDFSATYPGRGDGFIEAHHTIPVHTLTEGSKTRPEDMALVCSNCHRMIHAKRPWLTIEELKAILVRQ